MERIVIPDSTIPRVTIHKKQSSDKVMNLHSELLRVRKQIKELQDRERELQASVKTARLQNHLAKKAEKAAAKMRIPYKLYILELTDGKYYVGITRDMDKRYKQHLKGKGSNWTRLHKPVRIKQVIETTTKVESEAALMEDKLTIETAIQYGLNNVRGGGYCQTRPTWPPHVYTQFEGVEGRL